MWNGSNSGWTSSRRKDRDGTTRQMIDEEIPAVGETREDAMAGGLPATQRVFHLSLVEPVAEPDHHESGCDDDPESGIGGPRRTEEDRTEEERDPSEPDQQCGNAALQEDLEPVAHMVEDVLTGHRSPFLSARAASSASMLSFV